MHTAAPTTAEAWRPWLRAALILGAGGLAVFAGSLIVPVTTSATPLSLRAEGPVAGAYRVESPMRAMKMPAYIGTLTGRDFAVDVYIGRKGPLYTVKDETGSVLGVLLTSEEVHERFPDLDIGGMNADYREASASPAADSEP